jgi:hypothetical protein
MKGQLTFRNVTLAALALWLVTLSIALWQLNHSGFPAATAKNYRKICSLTQSPLFVIADFALAGLVFWTIRRFRKRYYLACLYAYGMFLGNVLGLIETWIVCRHL